MTDGNGGVSRRAFIRTAGGVTAAAAATGTASAQNESGNQTGGNETGGNQTGGGGNQSGGGGNESSGGSGGGGGGTTHTVDMTDGLIFDPDSITIAPGDTIEWVNVGSVGHSVTMYEEEIPEGATYWASGDFDSEEAARSNYPDQGDVAGGESVSYTFETTGTYGYFCIPHEAAGMVAEVVVEEGGGGGGGGGGGEGAGASVPQVPDSAKTLGVATVFSMVATLGLAFFFMKYGGDYETEMDG
jgi:plastocyanin